MAQMFSKKHYEAIAGAILDELDSLPEGLGSDHSGREYQTHQVAKRIADLFERDSSNFNRDRFLAACGLPSEEGPPAREPTPLSELLPPCRTCGRPWLPGHNCSGEED